MKKDYRTAGSFWTRMRGRLGETTPSKPLYIPSCNAVHTFGMKFPLRLTWFDDSGKIIKEQLAVPNKFYGCRGAKSVLESHPEEKPTLINNESGQALVEAAFALPVLLVIVFGFIQVGLAVHQSQKLTYVTHYATQVGALTNDPNKISGAIEEFLAVDDFSLSIESRDQDSNLIGNVDRQHNDILTIKVDHPFALRIPLISISVINLTAEASARILCPNTTAPYTCNS